MFADGISTDLKYGDVVWQINGTDGNDQVTSPMWGSAEIFDGGKGNDFLDGTAGSDTYLYASGDGSDEIDVDVGFLDDGNVDVLKLTDLNSSDIALSRDGDNLKVTVAATGDIITIDNQFDLAPKFYPILSSLQRFLVSVFATIAAGCGAEPFRLRSTASRHGLIV